MGPDTEMNNITWRCCCQLSAELSLCMLFSFLKLRRQLSETAMEHNCQAHPNSMEIQGVIILGNAGILERQKQTNWLHILFLKAKNALNTQ